MDQRILLPNHDILRLADVNQKPIIVVKPDGTIFWKGREVETDDDFRAAMIELAKHLGQKR